jgi:hypothetical protein
MRRNLNESLGGFVGKTERLGKGFVTPLPGDTREALNCNILHQQGRYFLLVSLISLWAEYTRELVVRSALGTITNGGTLVPPAPGIRTVNDIKGIVQLSGPGANWHWVTHAARKARRLGIRNYNQVTLGLGAAPVAQVMSVRNFVVHPNETTRSEYIQTTRNLRLLGLEPDDLLARRVPGGATVFEQWIADFQLAALNAAR